MHRCLLILNEKSRSGAESREPIVAALHNRGAALVGGTPLPPQRLEKTLSHLHPGEADRILLGGGDGTLNAALPALLRADLPLGVLPLGTANDFANSLGIPMDEQQAVQVALDGRAVRVDVGQVDERPYLNVASIGLGPKVTENLSAELKARLGFLGYPRAMLRAYSDTRPFRVRVTPDSEPARHIHCLHLAVGNGRRYGGGAVIAQGARLVDGRLHLFALAPIPLWRLILLAPWLGSGRHRRIANSAMIEASRFRVEASRPLPVSADGEIVGRTPVTFDVLPGALAVMVPRDGPEQEPALEAE